MDPMFKAAMESEEWYDVAYKGVVFRKAVVTAKDGTRTLVTIPKRDDLKIEYTLGTDNVPPQLIENRKERRRLKKSDKGKGKNHFESPEKPESFD
jgi:hypothetical protein